MFTHCLSSGVQAPLHQHGVMQQLDCNTSVHSSNLSNVSTSCLILPHTVHRNHHGFLYCQNVTSFNRSCVNIILFRHINDSLLCPDAQQTHRCLTALSAHAIQLDPQHTRRLIYTPVTEVWLGLDRSSRISQSVNKHPWPSPEPNFIQIGHKMYNITFNV